MRKLRHEEKYEMDAYLLEKEKAKKEREEVRLEFRKAEVDKARVYGYEVERSHDLREWMRHADNRGEVYNAERNWRDARSNLKEADTSAAIAIDDAKHDSSSA